MLKKRLLEISEALLEHKGQDIHRIMDGINAKKLCSSMTLFEVAGDNDEGYKLFGEILDSFFGGNRDERTFGVLMTLE